MDYAMKVYPMHFENGKTEWCVEYPDLKGCVGGGDTIEEAIADAEATKAVYLRYLEENEKEQCSKSLFKLIQNIKIILIIIKWSVFFSHGINLNTINIL